MKVKNINGNGDVACNCASWLEHWMRFSGQPLTYYCPVVGCLHRPELGAHVQLDRSGDSAWYVIPLCRLHAEEPGGTLDVGDLIRLVPADPKVTCG